MQPAVALWAPVRVDAGRRAGDGVDVVCSGAAPDEGSGWIGRIVLAVRVGKTQVPGQQTTHTTERIHNKRRDGYNAFLDEMKSRNAKV